MYLKILSLIALLCVPALGFAKIEYSERFEYYDIYPVSVADVKVQLVDKSPVRIDGENFMAKTRWSVQTAFWAKFTMVGTGVKRTDIFVKVAYTMPRLAEGCCADDIIHHFDSFYEKLMLHEKGHSQHALNCMATLSHELMKTQPQADFKALKKLFYQRNNAIIAGCEDLSNRYDVETNHGYTQGAFIR